MEIQFHSSITTTSIDHRDHRPQKQNPGYRLEMATITASAMNAKINSLRALTTSFLASLPTPANPSTQFTIAPSADPLPPLADASKVLKAQITKLGLLLINKPLTPSAIHAILSDLEVRVLPAFLVSGEQSFGRRNTYGDVFVFEVVDLMRGVLSSMAPLLSAVNDVVTAGKGASKDAVLGIVGKVFSACDGVIGLIALGVVGLLLRKIKEQVGLIQDAMSELQEWGEDVDDEAREDGNTEDEDDEDEKEKARTIEEMTAGLSMNSSGQLPGWRTDLVELLPEATRRADLSVKLCQALSKRRIKKFTFLAPPFATQEVEDAQANGIKVFQQIYEHAQGIQGDIDEVAAGFYESDVDMVKCHLVQLTGRAKAISGLVVQTRDGRDDEFTEWINTWGRLLDKRESLIIST